MRAIFVDLETGGLDPEKCAVTQIGAVLFDTDAEDPILDRLHVMVRPYERGHICLAALKVQGWEWEDLQENAFRHPEPEAFGMLTDFLRKHLGEKPPHWQGRAFAQYAQFDYSFLREMANRVPGTAGLFPYRSWFACTREWWKLLQAKGLAPAGASASLADYAPLLGVTNDNPHDALSDAVTGARCVKAMLEVERGERRLT